MPSLVIHARYDRDDIAERILPALAGFTIFSAFATLMTRMGHLRKRFIAYFITVFNIYIKDKLLAFLSQRDSSI